MASVTVGQSISETAKSPGSWFFAGNAALNTQTHPMIAFGYAALFATQRGASHFLAQRINNPVAKFILGPQGPLFVNAVFTALVGLVTQRYGAPELAAACWSFSGANLIQALVFGGAIKFGDSKIARFAKNSVLALCETSILYGLSKVAQNAGFDSQTALAMVAPGVLFALARSFKPKLLPPSLAYMDMMMVAASTGVEAAATGNYLNAFSRVLAFTAFSRLAVARAQNDGRSTFLQVEKSVPWALRYVRSKLRWRQSANTAGPAPRL